MGETKGRAHDLSPLRFSQRSRGGRQALLDRQVKDQVPKTPPMRSCWLRPRPSRVWEQQRLARNFMANPLEMIGVEAFGTFCILVGIAGIMDRDDSLLDTVWGG